MVHAEEIDIWPKTSEIVDKFTQSRLLGKEQRKRARWNEIDKKCAENIGNDNETHHNILWDWWVALVGRWLTPRTIELESQANKDTSTQLWFHKSARSWRWQLIRARVKICKIEFSSDNEVYVTDTPLYHDVDMVRMRPIFKIVVYTSPLRQSSERVNRLTQYTSLLEQTHS